MAGKKQAPIKKGTIRRGSDGVKYIYMGNNTWGEIMTGPKAQAKPKKKLTKPKRSTA